MYSRNHAGKFPADSFKYRQDRTDTDTMKHVISSHDIPGIVSLRRDFRALRLRNAKRDGLDRADGLGCDLERAEARLLDLEGVGAWLPLDYLRWIVDVAERSASVWPGSIVAQRARGTALALAWHFAKVELRYTRQV